MKRFTPTSIGVRGAGAFCGWDRKHAHGVSRWRADDDGANLGQAAQGARARGSGGRLSRLVVSCLKLATLMRRRV